MSAVGLDVDDVIGHIDSARHRAERCKGEDDLDDERRRPVERKDRPDEDEAVLHILMRPGEANERGQWTGLAVEICGPNFVIVRPK